MKSTITTNTYYREDCVIKETIVDGDVFEIVEQYFDEDGYLIYERTCDYSTEELMKLRRQQERKEKYQKENKKKTDKQSKVNKKLEKNRKRL